jgi:hypothetical protein
MSIDELLGLLLALTLTVSYPDSTDELIVGRQSRASWTPR